MQDNEQHIGWRSRGVWGVAGKWASVACEAVGGYNIEASIRQQYN